jgi:hypothetical protein
MTDVADTEAGTDADVEPDGSLLMMQQLTRWLWQPGCGLASTSWRYRLSGTLKKVEML